MFKTVSLALILALHFLLLIGWMDGAQALAISALELGVGYLIYFLLIRQPEDAPAPAPPAQMQPPKPPLDPPNQIAA